MDWWLLQQFPGRTLDELDSMDILRLFRAQEVGRIAEVERRRADFLAGKLKMDDLDTAEWRTIARHDRLVAGDNGDSA